MQDMLGFFGTIMFVITFVWLLTLQSKVDELGKNLFYIRKKLESYSAKDVEQPVVEQKTTEQPAEKLPKETATQPVEQIKEPEKEEQPVSQDIPVFYAKQKNKSQNLEQIFLGNIFNKVGAIAIIIALIIFAKLISALIVFTPVMKTVLGYLAGFGMIFASVKMKSEKLKNYSAVLMGTGFAALFIITFCACGLLKVFSSTVALWIGALVMLGAYCVSDRKKNLSMLIITLIGGYLTPVCVGSISLNYVSTYLIFLNIISLIYVLRNNGKYWINFVNLLVTSLMLLLYSLISSTPINISIPLVLWLVYLVYDILPKNIEQTDEFANSLFIWLNFAVLTFVSYVIYYDNIKNVGYLLLAVGLMYAGMAVHYYKVNYERFRTYIYSLIIVAFLTTSILTQDLTKVILWSLEGLLLNALAVKFDKKYLANWSFAFLLPAVTRLLFLENVAYTKDLAYYIPIANLRLQAFAVPIASLAGSYFVLKDKDFGKNFAQIFNSAFWSLVYLFGVFEINDFIASKIPIEYSRYFLENMILCVIGFVYTLQFGNMFNRTKHQVYNILSGIVGVVTVFGLIFGGYTFEPSKLYFPVLNVRCFAYIAAIFTAWKFSKWKNMDIFKYLALFLGFLLIHTESADTVLKYTKYDLRYLISVMWVIYCSVLTLIGIFKNFKVFTATGIAVAILAVLRIFIYDLATVSAISKLIAFLTLGIMLMLLSYVYTKYKSENNG